MIDLGAANKYDFFNPQKWHTVESVPLLDEHTMTDGNGNPIADVNRQALQEIANNNNRKVRETGDPATLILGHTSDDPRAEEKPAQGFVVNYRVKPFKRNQDGQIIYAIHGDYKLRHNKAHLVEDYPRRSVELWWHKKDIDPIAMLGGSSPERELGVVLRKSRNAIQLNHITLETASGSTARINTGNTPNTRESEVVKFSRRGSYDIETYYIEDTIPTYKYSKRRIINKESQMNNKNSNSKPKKYSGFTHKDPDGVEVDSKRVGPIRKSEQENETPIRTPKYTPSSKPPMKRPQPQEMEEGPEEMDYNGSGDEMPVDLDQEPQRYDELDQDMGEHGEGSPDYDGGGEAIPGEEGIDEDENDPVLAKVFQSKQWNEMSSGIDQIKQMLSGIMGQGQEEEPGMDGEGMGEEEMPPPGDGMGGMQQAPPVGAEGMGEEEPEEENQASMHGQKPVKMNAGMSTGMPGLSNTYIPNNARAEAASPNMSKKSPSKMSRPGSNNPMSNRSTIRPKASNLEIEFARLKKQNHDMRLQLSRMKAQADIQQLESEGIMFGPTPEVADKIKYAREQELTLAYLHDEDSVDETGEPDTYVVDKVNEMRTCYSRRPHRPGKSMSTQNVASLARYSRSEADVTGMQISTQTDDDNFEDKLGELGSFQAITEFAEIQSGPKALSREAAIKFSRKKYGIK